VRTGIRVALDVGSVRVGVARSDPAGTLAVPVETVVRDEKGRSDLTRIARIVAEYDALEVLVGLPVGLSGAEGAAAALARGYADQIARQVHPVPVRMVDERLSTVSAHRSLQDAGVRGRKRRPVVDQAAAVVILQSALDAERASGRPPGVLATPGPAPESPAPSRRAGEAGPR
jgi:putative Holliday junction resolvase